MERQISDKNRHNAIFCKKCTRISREIKSMIDIRRARTPSSLWRYAGLDKAHAKFNPRLKALVLGPLARSIIKDNPVYARYRRRILSSSPNIDRVHLHRMATRYMVKQHLKHLHLQWRREAGLPIPKEYDSDR